MRKKTNQKNDFSKDESNNNFYNLAEKLSEKLSDLNLIKEPDVTLNTKKIKFKVLDDSLEIKAKTKFNEAVKANKDSEDDNLYITHYTEGINCNYAHIAILYRNASLIAYLADSSKTIKPAVYLGLIGHLLAIEIINDLNLKVDKIVSPYLVALDTLKDLQYSDTDKFGFIPENIFKRYNNLHLDKLMYNPYMVYDVNASFSKKQFIFGIVVEDYLTMKIRDKFTNELPEYILKNTPNKYLKHLNSSVERSLYNDKYYFETELSIYNLIKNRELLEPLENYKDSIYISGKQSKGKAITGGVFWNHVGLSALISKQSFCNDDLSSLYVSTIHMFKRILEYNKLDEVNFIYISEMKVLDFIKKLNKSDLMFDVSDSDFEKLLSKLTFIDKDKNVSELIVRFENFKTDSDKLETLIDINNSELYETINITENVKKLVKVNF